MTRFADVPGLHPLTLKALTDRFGYTDMSPSQAAYVEKAMDPTHDLLVKASTGSGKTLGFLIPTVQRLVRSRSSSSSARLLIRALVLSPSRELAEQTRREAEKLCEFHGLGVQVVIGGTGIGGERQRLSKEKCDILVATPGRLQAHIDETPGFAARLRGVKVLVLDEADRLLDMGFEPAIRRIAAALSAPEARQTLLFTATVSETVRGIASAFTRPGKLVFVDTSTGSRKSRAYAVNSNIVQEAIVLPIRSLVPALHRVVLHHRSAAPDHKIIVFVSNAVTVQFLAALFRAAGMPDALEIHSRLDQRKRDAADRAFRERSGVLMFASDVAARGVDFPNVTLVVQLGIADTAENVVHRVGRTGRGGKSGSALMILGEDERPVLDGLLAPPLKMPIAMSARDSQISAGVVSGDEVAPLPPLREAFEAIASEKDDRGKALRSMACRAVAGSLGFYNTHAAKRLRWSKPDLVKNVVARFAAVGVPGWCPIEPRTLKKMRLDGFYDAPDSRVRKDTKNTAVQKQSKEIVAPSTGEVQG